MSPTTSPRLPSPPPFPEVQIGPKSPSLNPGTTSAPPSNTDAPKINGVSADRIRPGTKAVDMAAGPPLVPLEEIDSPFALQIYLKALWHQHTKGSSTTTQSITRETAQQIATPPQGVDRSLWLYELCRVLVVKANDLFVAFFSDAPPCSAQTCPEMRASEWQYLCAVHDPPKSCCAIDYCAHTLDWAGDTLTSQKHFPSRLALGGEGPGSKQQAERQITNIFRRVYRIFAHAWFQHRQIFWNVEGKSGSYVLFKTVCDMYALIPSENYTIPPEAQGIITSSSEAQPPPPVIMKKQPDESKPEDGDASTTTISTGATTRRHKHTPSTGSAVTTIQEGEEEEHEAESFPMMRETPSVQRVGSGLRDVHSDGSAQEKPPPRPIREDTEAPKEVSEDPAAELSKEPPEEDYTISEPVVQAGEDKAETTEPLNEGKGTGEAGAEKEGDIEK